MEHTEAEKLMNRILELMSLDENKTRFDTKDEAEIVREWCNNHHITEPTLQDMEDCEEHYQGYYSSEREFAEHIVDECGYLEEVPSNIAFYFDYEKFGRDLFMSGDFWMSDGHVFRSM